MSSEERKARRKKVLMLGPSGSGKSSMRAIIFSNYLPKDTQRLGPTKEVENNNIRFLGKLTLNLWDCGGQGIFMEKYLTTDRQLIFEHVQVLIYVFNVDSPDFTKDLRDYSIVLQALQEYSPNATIFALIHKMDLVQANVRDRLLQERTLSIHAASAGLKHEIFGTTIWDQTLYKAWAKVVFTLVPNLPVLQKHLEMFAEITDAEEIILFERTTFLLITSVSRTQHEGHRLNPNLDRFEKISSIVKTFKSTCIKLASNFLSLEMTAAHFSAFIDILTPNTYVLMVFPKDAGEKAVLLNNIAVGKKYFEKLEREVLAKRAVQVEAEEYSNLEGEDQGYIEAEEGGSNIEAAWINEKADGEEMQVDAELQT
ncbi:hypothetical protein EX30DRAFT_302283 [Ascodesmis nigricans]|uniref:GTP-binding protein n=1 Tax=Ascodesmis nigricans TaxID=341454 RepID=A0A4S2N3C7_9PEZI|nr:hypothetical protein EX30DRAFT_302283 [Ascodesmis nigricans]